MIMMYKGPSKNWLSPVLKIAALFVVCFGLYQFTNFNSDPTFNTEIAQKDKIELPDHSIVTLNALSSIDFDKEQWNSDRNVSLKGEAFFDVEKGATFNVNTKHGVITVYGTEFNVKARNNYFEVICYEGLVGVSYSDEEIKLNPGDSFLVIDNIVVVQNKSKGEQPSWLNNESTFNSIPYKEVIAEFERQYDINIVTKSVDLDVLFTGGFSHTDIETSLKSITLPLQLTYIKKGNTITIKRD